MEGQLSVGSVQEQSPARLRLSFVGFDGAQELPTTLHYRVDLLNACPPIVIRQRTQVLQVASEVDVILDSTDNDFYSGVGESEYHVITVTSNLDQTDELNKTFLYEVTKIAAAPLIHLLAGTIKAKSGKVAVLTVT